MNSGQRKVTASNNQKQAILPFNSQNEYVCSNADITRGMTQAPYTISDCFNRFPSIYEIAKTLGFTSGYNLGVTGTTFYNLWTGPGTGFTAPALLLGSQGSGLKATIPGITGGPKGSYLHDASDECKEVYGSSGATGLGQAWLGCLWGSPESPYSCICPEIGEKFHAYLKLRLNIATFWNTPKQSPVKRQEFMDEIKYGRKLTIVVGGDFGLNLGQVVEISADGSSGYPYDVVPSTLNGKYWIIGIKHVVTNGGTHETALTLSKLAETTPWQLKIEKKETK
jgi:hypothetical protein